MKKTATALAAAALLGLATVAYAAETSGRIATADSSTLILEDGTTFVLAEGVSLEGLQPGTPVNISYEEKDGQMIATAVVPAQ